MRPIASGLTDLLAEECRQRIGQTRRDLRNHGLLRERLEKQARGMAPAMLFSVQGRALDAPPPGGVGGEIERSILDILQAQREQMQKADEALAQGAPRWTTRKTCCAAKRLLMRTRRLSEPDAHAWLQRAAMQSGRTLIDVARQVLAAAG
ncbi:ANTAR domain-containing protein [Achromobacter sp. DMS1]|uniref:ANTAR domain-containing protein n=1 Tax=Achromobacter sp. DMS1 TaxID=1688405 RepID=UPI000A9A7AFB|nr:ANTAR domain-containing protein [Achromobacter sp. DMS1]